MTRRHISPIGMLPSKLVQTTLNRSTSTGGWRRQTSWIRGEARMAVADPHALKNYAAAESERLVDHFGANWLFRMIE